MLAALLVAAAANTRLFEPRAPGTPEAVRLARSPSVPATPESAFWNSPSTAFLAPAAATPQALMSVEPVQASGSSGSLSILTWASFGAAVALLALHARSQVQQTHPSVPAPVAMLAVQGASGMPARQAAASRLPRTTTPSMINLFGNSEESKKQRQSLSLRDAPAGSRKVTFRKPNAATTGLLLGLKFRETFGKAILIDKIIPNTEAARLKQQGKINEGDEVVMVSATFGNEMWSARNIGKYRLEKSLAVRQGMTVSLVLENPDLEKRKANSREAKKQREFQSRLQKQLQDEVDTEKKKGWFNF